MRQGELILSLPYIAGFFDGEGSIGIYRAVRHGRERFCLRTQLTQNLTQDSKRLFEGLNLAYGGAFCVMDRKAEKLAVNWQLNSGNAVRFLSDIEPFLWLKGDQARIAIAWQKQRPAVIRNERGHICYKSEPVLDFDRKVCELMKELKTRSIDQVMENQHDLVEVVHVLKQVLCVKGA